MGGKLSTTSKFGSRRHNRLSDSEYGEPPSIKVVGLTSCFEGKRLRKKKKNKNKNKKEGDQVSPEPSEKKAKLTRHHLTLEEWILSSPETDVPRTGGNELFLFMQVYKSKSPSSSICSNSVTVEEGLPSRRAVPEGAEGCREDGASICRSESKSLRKKVSFRLPEETDSIVFYTPSPAENDLKVEIATAMTSQIVISSSP